MRVPVKDNNVTIALRKLKRKMDDNNVLQDYLAHREYVKPSVERKRKAGASRARWLKQQKNDILPKKMY